MKHLVLLCLSIAIVQFTVSQETILVPWSATRKLQASDFQRKADSVPIGNTYAAFALNCQSAGDSKLMVTNNMVSSISWIDTSKALDATLRYEQTLFDLSEIYARQLRKKLRENRKEVSRDLDVARALFKDALSARAQRQSWYDNETHFGNDDKAQGRWAEAIAAELRSLKDYSVKED